MCVPGCQEALQAALSRRGFFKGAAAAGFAATAIVPAEAAEKKPKKAAPAAGTKAPEGQSYFKGVVDLTHTMSPDFPTFFGVPGIEMQKQYRFQEGRLQPELVADHRARRHPSRRADPFLGRRRHRGHDRRWRTGGAARRHRRAQAGARRIPTI